LVDHIHRLIANSIVKEQLLPASSTLSAIAHNSAVAARFGMQAVIAGEGNGEQSVAERHSEKSAAIESLGRLEQFFHSTEICFGKSKRIGAFMFYDVA